MSPAPATAATTTHLPPDAELRINDLIDEAVSALLADRSPARQVEQLLAVEAGHRTTGAAAAEALQDRLYWALAPLTWAWVTQLDTVDPQAARAAALGRDAGPGRDQADAAARSLGNAALSSHPDDPIDLAAYAVNALMCTLSDTTVADFPAGERYPTEGEPGYDQCGLCQFPCGARDCLTLRADLAYMAGIDLAAYRDGLRIGSGPGWFWPLDGAPLTGEIAEGGMGSTPAQLLWAWLVALAAHERQIEHHLVEEPWA